MVAYNFQKQFGDRIVDGSKNQTVRRTGKRRHANPGDMVQLYTGQRTTSCKKLVDDRTCLAREPIQIVIEENSVAAIRILGKPITKTGYKTLEAFAIADGFESLEAFHRFWRKFHGVGVFDGELIVWGEV